MMFRSLVVLSLLSLPLPAAEPETGKEGMIERVEYTLKTPRSREPVLGGSRENVAVSVWLPADVQVVRGAICNPFSRGDSVSPHWRAACQHWRFAYVQVDFDGVKKEEFVLLQKGLIDLARTTRHPELEHVPLCFLGMSRGGGMSLQLAELMPERTIASVPVCLEVGPTSDATRRIPVLTIFGEKDGSQMKQLLDKLPIQRKQDAEWAIAVQWNRKHEFGQANNLAIPFLDEVIRQRVPAVSPTDKRMTLTEIPREAGWLADVSTWSKEGRWPVVASWKDFPGDRSTACWLPSQKSAAVWQAFLGGTKDVTITEPAGLGDGQTFRTHSAKKPVIVKVGHSPALKPDVLELWDGDVRLGEKKPASGTFEVSLKPGIHALYGVVRTAGSVVRTSRPNTIIVEPGD